MLAMVEASCWFEITRRAGLASCPSIPGHNAEAGRALANTLGNGLEFAPTAGRSLRKACRRWTRCRAGAALGCVAENRAGEDAFNLRFDRSAHVAKLRKYYVGRTVLGAPSKQAPCRGTSGTDEGGLERVKGIEPSS